MFKKNAFILLVFILLFGTACEENSSGLFQHPGKKYFGEYEVQSLHTAFYPTWPVEGEPVWVEGTEAIFDPVLTIEKDKKDSLIIKGLINKWEPGDFRQEVKAIVEDDTLRIIFDQTALIMFNKIGGKIWIRGDSIFLDYWWNQMDNYNFSSSPPRVGSIQGRGKTLD